MKFKIITCLFIIFICLLSTACNIIPLEFVHSIYDNNSNSLHISQYKKNQANLKHDFINSPIEKELADIEFSTDLTLNLIKDTISENSFDPEDTTLNPDFDEVSSVSVDPPPIKKHGPYEDSTKEETNKAAENSELTQSPIVSNDPVQTVTPTRTTPNGDYSLGSIYGPKLNQDQLYEVADAVQTFVNSFDFSTMDEYTKILTAHNYLCDTCSYAADWSKNYANTAWGALIYHEAQCSGYARAMKALCDSINVGCYYVHADENSVSPSHQWNECCINGTWYIMDVPCNDNAGYLALFLVSDDTYAQATGMSWNRSLVPACPVNYE